jgi:hypothetical protein
MFVETLENLQHSTQLISESRSYKVQCPTLKIYVHVSYIFCTLYKKLILFWFWQTCLYFSSDGAISQYSTWGVRQTQRPRGTGLRERLHSYMTVKRKQTLHLNLRNFLNSDVGWPFYLHSVDDITKITPYRKYFFRGVHDKSLRSAAIIVP